MRVLLLIYLLYLSSCSLFDENGIEKPENYRPCDMEMDINGEPWSDIHPDDETANMHSGSFIADPLDRHEFEGSPMRISCTRNYQSPYVEHLRFFIVMPENYSTSDLASHKVDYQNPKYPEYESIGFSENQYDFGLAHYDTDTTRTANLEITEVDTVNHRFIGTFEFTLYADEHNIDSGRLPDTLNITNGEFEVEYNDTRE